MRIPGIPFHQGRNDYTDVDGMHYGIAIHNTSNVASDVAEASYADHRPDGTSAHFYVDADSVTQSLDTNARAGHAGSRQGNDNAIAFELTGTNDRSRQWWLDNIAWGKLGEVIAYILRNDPDYQGFQVRRALVAEMRGNPRVRAFYGHDDMRRAWGGTDHTDPGPGFPWDRLFAAVNAALSPAAAAAGEEDTMGASFGPIEIQRQGVTSLCIPPVQAGIADPRQVWLNIANDSADKPYALRVWVSKGDQNWTALSGHEGGYLKLASGEQFSQQLDAGVRIVSISRKSLTFAGDVVEPSPNGVGPQPYDGHLTCCFERA